MTKNPDSIKPKLPLQNLAYNLSFHKVSKYYFEMLLALLLIMRIDQNIVNKNQDRWILE